MAFNPGVINTLTFSFVLCTMLLLTGTWILLTVCFVTALTVALLMHHFVFGKRVRPAGKSAILITGCSTGIGHDAALHLARSGFIVFATVRKEEDGKAIVERLDKEATGKIVPILMDVTKEGEVHAAAQKVAGILEAEGAYLHGIVNNAGYAEGSFLEIVPIPALKQQFDVNVFGLMAVTQAFLPLLRKGPKREITRRIVNITSMNGKIVTPIGGPYCGTKFAVEAMSDAMRQELSLWGINVVIVEPGAIASAFTATLGKTIERNLEEAQQAEARVGTEVYQKYQKWTVATAKAGAASSRASTEWTTAAIEGALFDKSPLVRYMAGPDAQLLLPILTKVPDAAKDFLFSTLARRSAGVA